MTELGKVVAVKNGSATVKIDKKDECSKCGMCAFPKNASSISVNATNPVDAKEGDEVIIEREEKGKLLGALLAFLVPLFLIGICVFIGYVLIKSEIWILILSVISVALWYTILALIDKKLATLSGFSSKIVKIVSERKEKEINE